MALVGDALSHVALPGVALAILFNVNPFVGAFVTLFAGIIGIWLIEHKTELSVESIVGLFFTISLAVGILITPDEHLVEALFGDISAISTSDTFIAVVISLIVVWGMRSISKSFILGTISPDLAKASGAKVAQNNFVFMFLVALVVALGIKAIGTLLMGALVIIPAIASKNFTSSMKGYTVAGALIGLISLAASVIFAGIFLVPAGPLAVLISAGIFLISLAFKK